jgi:glycerophosphoryl diester phosphodiesterase
MFMRARKCFFFLLMLLAGDSVQAQKGNTLKFANEKALQAYFQYNGNKSPIISGHRGTAVKGYPENSIEAMEYVLKYTPAFFEIDPRLTKDSVIVLLHDATLDRTTTGKGKLSEYTWEEVKQLRLKDVEGNVTPYRIPTLAEAIEWARGKTVLNLDKKDVPLQLTADIIRKHKAGAFVMVTVHNAEQAKFYYDDDHARMLSAHVKSEKAFKEYDASGVPWRNMIAYIGSENKPENKTMFDLLHSKGVRCMLSAAPKYDKLKTAEERAAAYRETFAQGADILESDLPVEVAAAIKIETFKKAHNKARLAKKQNENLHLA